MTIRPEQIRIEASSVCQLKCPSCPTGLGINKSSEVGHGFLKVEKFRQLLAENPWLKRVELSNWGEIFLNKEIAEVFKVAHAAGVAVHASNGVNLNNATEEALEASVKYRVEKFTCSIDGASQATYSQYRRGGCFENVIENIRKINSYKKKYATDYPKLVWQFVIFGLNEKEIPVAREMAKSLNMKFKPKLSWDENFSPIQDEEFVQKETGLKAKSRSDFLEKNKENYMRSVCLQLWEEPQVNFDGKLLGCCINTWGSFGNVFVSGLEAGLNSEKIDYARQMLQGKKRVRSDIPCASCTKYLDIKKHKAWVRDAEVAHTVFKRDSPKAFFQKCWSSLLSKIKERTR